MLLRWRDALPIVVMRGSTSLLWLLAGELRELRGGGTSEATLRLAAQRRRRLLTDRHALT